MENSTEQICSRRHFLSAIPCLAAGSALAVESLIPDQQQTPYIDVGGPFSEDEKAAIEKSAMAKDILNFAGQGYSCAESMFMVCLRKLGQDEKWVRAAAAYGGGIGKRDLCGLFTGGMMGIGVAAGEKHDDLQEMHALSREWSNAYWAWWENFGPVHCSDLSPMYEGREAYLRLCQRVAAGLEKIIS